MDLFAPPLDCDVVIIPTYNESHNICALIRKIFITVPEIHIVVVDDSSPDNTAGVVHNLIPEFPRLSLISRPQKTGLGDAYKEVFSLIGNGKSMRSVITMDADSSHDPVYLPYLLQLSQKYDLVIGSRYVAHGKIERWQLWRRWLSALGNRYARTVLRSKILDLTSGFVLMKRDVVKAIPWKNLSSSNYAYTLEMKIFCEQQLRARWIEIPIIFQERRTGISKLSLATIVEGLAIPWRILFKRHEASD